MLSIISSIIFPTTQIKEREKLKSEHSIKASATGKTEGNLCLSMVIKILTKLEKRGKLMSEHAHNKCTGNWKKERVKVMLLSMLLKKKTPGFYEHAQT